MSHDLPDNIVISHKSTAPNCHMTYLIIINIVISHKSIGPMSHDLPDNIVISHKSTAPMSHDLPDNIVISHKSTAPNYNMTYLIRRSLAIMRL